MGIGGRTRGVARVSTEEADVRLNFIAFIVSIACIPSRGYVILGRPLLNPTTLALDGYTMPKTGGTTDIMDYYTYRQT